MAITQERMIKVLEAAGTLIHDFEMLTQELKSFHTSQDVANARVALHNAGINHPAIDIIVGSHNTLLETISRYRPNYEAAAAVAEERGHFNVRRKANEKAAEYMRNMRRRLKEREIEMWEETVGDASGPGLPIVKIDMTVLHRRVFAFWKFSTANQDNLITSTNIEDILKEMGLNSLEKWTELIAQMLNEGRLIKGNSLFASAGAFTVAEPPQAALSDSEPPPSIPDPVLETENPNPNPTKPEALLPAFRSRSPDSQG